MVWSILLIFIKVVNLQDNEKAQYEKAIELLTEKNTLLKEQNDLYKKTNQALNKRCEQLEKQIHETNARIDIIAQGTGIYI